MTAIGGPYADRATLKRRMNIPDSDTRLDSDLDAALAQAADDIHRFCGRQFGRQEVATERIATVGPIGLDVDDFWTTDGLIISGGAYSVDRWSLEPAGGIRDQMPGWPYERIMGARTAHPIYWSSGWLIGQQIAVTAKWGWESVPANVVRASLTLAEDAQKSGDAPFGVAGFGDYAVRLRANPIVEQLLLPFQKDRVKAA